MPEQLRRKILGGIITQAIYSDNPVAFINIKYKKKCENQQSFIDDKECIYLSSFQWILCPGILEKGIKEGKSGWINLILEIKSGRKI